MLRSALGTLTTFAVLLAAGPCPKAWAAEAADRRKQLENTELQATPAAIARKNRSDALLRKEGVPVNESLPAIEDESQVRKRKREEIAYRALSLLTVAMKGEGLDSKSTDDVVAQFGLAAHLTPEERRFVRERAPSQDQRSRFSWRYEAAWVMLWALGYVEQLDKPTTECDVRAEIAIMRQRTEQQFITDAKLRPLSEMIEQADRIYRYHWAVVDARLNGGDAGGLNSDVTLERHQALNWLIGYEDQEWDDVTTDT
jgi:hypothetical protein